MILHRLSGWLLAAGARGIARWVWIALIAAAMAAAFVIVAIAKNRDAALIETATDAGAAEAVIAGHETTFEQLEDADDAEQDLRSSGERNAARYDDCLRNSRTGNCERFRPLGE